MAQANQQRFLDELGEHLAKVRKSKNMTQEQLASETGLDRVAIAYIETGKRRPTVTTIYKISKALGVSIESLFKGL